MTPESARDTFLTRVRDAVHTGNRPGAAGALRKRGSLGYQGGGPDLGQSFKQACEAAGGRVYLVPNDTAARECVLTLVRERSARRLLLDGAPLLDRIALPAALEALGVEVRRVQATLPEDRFFDADLSVTGVDYLIAETGSVVFLARPVEPRSVSLLPPVHVVVADATQLVPDFFDLFEGNRLGELPSCVSIITGPSKTGDIELRLVTGVHGPGEVHVVLMTSASHV